MTKAIQPDIVRIFARQFPGVTLTGVSSARHRSMGIGFQGIPQDLLRYGLIDPDMLPPGRKRHASGEHWHGGSWFVDREREGVVSVWRELPQEADHPLAHFASQWLRRTLAKDVLNRGSQNALQWIRWAETILTGTLADLPPDEGAPDSIAGALSSLQAAALYLEPTQGGQS